MLSLFEVLNRQFFTPNRIIPNGRQMLPLINTNMQRNSAMNKTILQQTVPTKREQISQMIINRRKFLYNVNQPIPDSEKNMKA